MPRLYLASNNPHKATELEAMFAELKQPWRVHLGRELSPGLSWNESGETFAANARIKAEAVRGLTSDCVLADDSGLVVDILGGAPGVHSSRYAGVEGDDQGNNAKLLQAVRGLDPASLTARFVCTLYFIDEQGRGHTFSGSCEGHLTTAASGGGGFGYDPLFIPAGSTTTMAAMTAAEKNRISHRRQAFAAFAAWLTARA